MITSINSNFQRSQTLSRRIKSARITKWLKTKLLLKVKSKLQIQKKELSKKVHRTLKKTMVHGQVTKKKRLR